MRHERGRITRIAVGIAVVGAVVGGCIFQEGTAVSVWAESNANRPLLLRVVLAGFPRVFYVDPGVRGWAISYDGSIAARAEVVDLSCQVIDAVELPQAGSVAVVISEDLRLRVSPGDPDGDPFAEVPELAQTCGNIRTCPIHSPWPTDVPFPSEPCPGRY